MNIEMSSDGKNWLALYEQTESSLGNLSSRVNSGAGLGSKKYEADRQLKQAKNSVTALDRALNDMEANPLRYGIGEGELTRRRGLVGGLNKLIVGIEDSLSGASKARRDLLGPRKDYGDGEESDTTKAMNERELHQATKQELQKQDHSLDALAHGVAGLLDVGQGISTELDLQTKLLGELDERIDKTDRAFQNNTRRIDVVQEEDGGAATGCCLMLCMLGLLILIIWLASSNSACHILPKSKC